MNKGCGRMRETYSRFDLGGQSPVVGVGVCSRFGDEGGLTHAVWSSPSVVCSWAARASSVVTVVPIVITAASISSLRLSVDASITARACLVSILAQRIGGERTAFQNFGLGRTRLALDLFHVRRAVAICGTLCESSGNQAERLAWRSAAVDDARRAGVF